MGRNNRIINVMEHRLSWLKEWLRMRNYQLREERMDYLYIVYSSAKTYLTDEAAKKATSDVNNMLTLPFSEEKLQQHIFDRVDNRECPLWFTNQTIMQKLKLTEEECQLLDPDKGNREREERSNRRLLRLRRNNTIIDLYQQKFSLDTIALQEGVSKRTVQRVIQKFRQEGEAGECTDATKMTIQSTTEIESVGANSEERYIAGRLLQTYKTDMLFAEVCDEQLRTLDFFENTNTNILLLGSAGCGKTYIVNEYLNGLSIPQRAKVLVVAPTWKAASNLNGITIHKAFALSCTMQNDTSVEFIPKPLKNIDTIIIDEISMLRVDLFNRMIQIIQYTEKKLNKRIRIIAIGDFGQLAPVCIANDKQLLEKEYHGLYCFHSPLWKSLNFKKVILYKTRRYEDAELAEQLLFLKYGLQGIVKWFNKKCSNSYSHDAITICTTNALVKEYTELYIRKNPQYDFEVFEAECSGPLTEELPVDRTIRLGYCRVLFLWNGKNYKRGDFGEIIHKTAESITVKMESTGEKVLVEKVTWTLANGTKYTQFPLCLACAITVNKAQGCTFDKINIDRGNGFWMPGQLYVALSRCRTLDGIRILKPLMEKDVHVDISALEMMLDDEIRF